MYSELTVFHVNFDCYVGKNNIHLVTDPQGSKIISSYM